MNTNLMFSSNTCEWNTPQPLFDKWDSEYHFTLDACATESNAKCSNFYTKEQNSLEQEWTGVVWCNPPYGVKAPLYGLFPRALLKVFHELIESLTISCDAFRQSLISANALIAELHELQSQNSLLSFSDKEWQDYLQNFSSLSTGYVPSVGESLVILARLFDSHCSNTKRAIEQLNRRLMSHFDLEIKRIGGGALFGSAIGSFVTLVNMYTTLSVNDTSDPSYKVSFHKSIIPLLGGFIQDCMFANAGIGQWVRKAMESANGGGATVVMLLPARTDTKWFHDIILEYASNVEFLKGRIRFSNAPHPAPFPSMIVVFEDIRPCE